MKYLVLPTLALLVSASAPFFDPESSLLNVKSHAANAQLSRVAAQALSVIDSAQAQTDGQSDDEPAPSVGPDPRPQMSVDRITELIVQLDDEAKVDGNVVEFTFAGRTIVMVAAPDANRMRLVSGIVEAQAMSEDQILATLVSNYHLALDARYAIGNGVLFSVYVHPLAELNESLLLSGIRQVANLAATFGSSYSSGEMSFGVQQQQDRVDI